MVARWGHLLGAKNLEPGPAEPSDLDDVCSSLSSLHSTLQQGFIEVVYGLGTPSRSPNTLSKVESGFWALERAAPSEIPTRALQATGGDTSRPRVLDTLVRDVANPFDKPLGCLPVP